MPTASYLIADVQAKLGDTSGVIYPSAQLLKWLNQAQTEFCQTVLPLRQVDATSISTGLQTFPLPNDYIIMEGVFSRNSIGIVMKHMTFTDWNNQMAACPGARGIDSQVWTELQNTVYVHPAYGVRAAQTLFNGILTATATTLTVTSTAGFKAWGRIRLDNEEMEYSSKDSTHFYGLTRGVGGTTAAQHNDTGGAAVYQLDLWMVYRRQSVDMGTVTDSPEIRSVWHEKLEYYVMYLAYLQAGEGEKSGEMYKKWNEALEEAQYAAQRETLSPMNLDGGL